MPTMDEYDFECEITADDGGGPGPGATDVVASGDQVTAGGVNVQAT